MMRESSSGFENRKDVGPEKYNKKAFKIVPAAGLFFSWTKIDEAQCLPFYRVRK